MVRKGSDLYRLQQQIFHDCMDAERFYQQCRHEQNTFTQNMVRESLAVYNELSMLISIMAWNDAYDRYCDQHPAENA